jgi:hypothetical protein
MNFLQKTKNLIIYSYMNKMQVGFGRTQLGNDQIIDKYQDVKEDCWWYHLAKETSAHLIIYDPGNELNIKVEKELLDEYFPVEKCQQKNKDPTIMKTKLNYVKKTNILGMVVVEKEEIIKRK